MVALVGCLLSVCACVAQTPVVYSVENVVDGWLGWLVACFPPQQRVEPGVGL